MVVKQSETIDFLIKALEQPAYQEYEGQEGLTEWERGVNAGLEIAHLIAKKMNTQQELIK